MNNRFNTTGAINLALLLVLFLFNIIQAQQVENVPGLIEVKFKKGAVARFDEGLNLESIKSSDLKNYLSNIGF
jgi:hypothetical protein